MRKMEYSLLLDHTCAPPTHTPAPPTNTAVPLTSLPVTPTKPASASWNPRGMIAFERRGEGSGLHQVYLMHNDRSRVENLTNYPADDGGPQNLTSNKGTSNEFSAWSPVL